MTLFKYSMKQEIKYLIILLAILLFLVFGCFGTNTAVVHAQQYDILETTGVMEDLESDILFNADNYPTLTIDEIKSSKTDDDEENDKYFLNVIQIAESKNRELAIYVYNPTANVTQYFSSIRFSLNRFGR